MREREKQIENTVYCNKITFFNSNDAKIYIKKALTIEIFVT